MKLSAVKQISGINRYTSVGEEELANMTSRSHDDDTFIIGAGFARTGTSSLQIALAKLGYRVYHMRDVTDPRNTGDMARWAQIGGIKTAKKKQFKVRSFAPSEWKKCLIDYDWNQIFNKESTTAIQYNGCIDFPCSPFYADLMRFHGDNYKVILTVRDSPKQWFESMRKTVLAICWHLENVYAIRAVSWMLNIPWTQFANNCKWQLLFDGRHEDEEYAMRKYEEWIESVKLYVPKEKLLVFNVKDGWKPLCEFLNRPIPDGEHPDQFPRSNDSENMQHIVKRLKLLRFVSNVVIVAVLAGMIAIFY